MDVNHYITTNFSRKSSSAAVLFFTVDKDVEKVNYLLISPQVRNSRLLSKSWRDRIDYSDDLDLVANCSSANKEKVICKD